MLVIVIFTLYEQPWLQILLIVYMNYAVWIFEIKISPMKTKKLNFLIGFNDYMVFLCSVNMIFFTDFLPESETKFTAGWMMC